MWAFISQNLATIIISVVLLGLVVLALRKVWKDRKNHSCSSCGGSCSGCSQGSHCNRE